MNLNIALIADLHTDGDEYRDRNEVLNRSFAGICSYTPALDAVVMAGDITNSAAECEYTNLNKILKSKNNLPRILPAMGNHDARGTSIYPDFEEGCELFRRFCAGQGIKTDKNYYYTTVNGYYFIMLGTDALLQNETFISPTQLEWLDKVLAEASESRKPVFIICHQPFNDTNHVEEFWSPGIMGGQSDEVKSAIKKYTDAGTTVLFISGHIHSEFRDDSLSNDGKNLWYLDLPSVQFTEKFGGGAVLEAYNDRLIIKTVNFITGESLVHTYSISV